jgi:hypothetical protein
VRLSLSGREASLTSGGSNRKPPSPPPRSGSLLAFTKAEQREIADERYRLEHSRLCELTSAGPQLATFSDAVLVFDDWGRMRDDIRAAGAAR